MTKQDTKTSAADMFKQEIVSEVSAQVEKRIKELGLEDRPPLEIKIGDMKPIKLDGSMHPKLPLLVKMAKVANATNSKHPYMVGPAGTGKTTLGHQIADALGLRFGHISLTAGASETWLWGRQTPNGFNVGQFADYYENGGVFLFDELDAADANLLIALNTALANGSAYNPIEGRQIKRHKDFYCIAAGNTFGMGADFAYTGRERLDAATLDRFGAIVVDYEPSVEKKICPDEGLRELLVEARNKLRDMQSEYANTITYRALSYAYAAFEVGLDDDPAKNATQVLEIITASWPKGLAQEIGVL